MSNDRYDAGFIIEVSHVRFEKTKTKKFLQQDQAYNSADMHYCHRWREFGCSEGDEKRAGKE